ncbi:hypothetical protein CkaCkLH20_01799 [Colletotrichum karsti]|uniref:Uncharacterized protein n=1 Tax=Colletotrichum karsti TaxID=1095194 RepID=A0A9P6LQI3_9PEZI|nr:uncharacterized protein CkaCkLH20_01799 [Colletotrichum karsti]KAF9880757.1 hypothetical protein CkaCkLH20_01799 [Colletotrichum karsti]
MTIKPMSEEDTTAHKRTASSTSAVAPGNSPPPKRPAPLPVRRDFPHAVALVLYRDGSDETSSTSVLGVYAALADANEEARRLAQEQGDAAVVHESAATEPVRWEAPDGASCWVEMHAVTPKKIVPRNVSSEQPPKKLYDAEEGEDPDIDDDDHDEGANYD